MPDRYLREAILRSERVGAISVGAVALYYKLISLVDDFGCFDGREHVITAHSGWRFALPLPLRELHEHDLIVRYLNADKPYIAITQWGEARRGRRKYPAPPCNTDIPGLVYTVPFNQHPNWRNPVGTDRISILLDLDGHPVDIQPREWRRVQTDWMPVGASAGKVYEKKQRIRGTAQHTGPVDSPSPPSSSVSVSSSSSVSASSSTSTSPTLPSAPPVPEPQQPSVLGQSTAPATAGSSGGNSNGKVGLTDAGEWLGVDEAQRLRWQAMFDTLSIPDTLRDAAVWLIAHPEERRVYTERGELAQYISRWLIREAKPDRTGRAKATADSQGKT